EYFTGWRYGRSGAEKKAVQYHCGPLADIAFSPAPTFAGMEFEPRLQLADLVVGATREFINFSLGGFLWRTAIQVPHSSSLPSTRPPNSWPRRDRISSEQRFFDRHSEWAQEASVRRLIMT